MRRREFFNILGGVAFEPAFRETSPRAERTMAANR
jgi:hypothetical protein